MVIVLIGIAFGGFGHPDMSPEGALFATKANCTRLSDNSKVDDQLLPPVPKTATISSSNLVQKKSEKWLGFQKNSILLPIALVGTTLFVGGIFFVKDTKFPSFESTLPSCTPKSPSLKSNLPSYPSLNSTLPAEKVVFKFGKNEILANFEASNSTLKFTFLGWRMNAADEVAQSGVVTIEMKNEKGAEVTIKVQNEAILSNVDYAKALFWALYYFKNNDYVDNILLNMPTNYVPCCEKVIRWQCIQEIAGVSSLSLSYFGFIAPFTKALKKWEQDRDFEVKGISLPI